MDIKQLRHFVAIIDCGSFLKAAEHVAISQPALSRSLAKLEDRYGTKLIDRTTRGIEITDAGQRLYQRAHLILNETDAAIKDLKRDPSEPSPFRIGVAPMFQSNLMPQIASALRAAKGYGDISIISGLLPKLSKGAAEGHLDVVLSNIPFAPLADGLTADILLDIRIGLIISSEHELASMKDPTFSDTMSFPWAVIDEENANDLYSYLFASHGITTNPIELRTNSLGFLRTIVRTPPWVCLLPMHMIAREIEDRHLIQLDLKNDRLNRKGGVIYRTALKHDPRISQFRKLVTQFSAEIFA